MGLLDLFIWRKKVPRQDVRDTVKQLDKVIRKSETSLDEFHEAARLFVRQLDDHGRRREPAHAKTRKGPT